MLHSPELFILIDIIYIYTYRVLLFARRHIPRAVKITGFN